MPSAYGWYGGNATTTANTATPWPGRVVYYTLNSDGSMSARTEPEEKTVDQLERDADWII